MGSRENEGLIFSWWVKVPLTPKNVFLLYKFPFSPDHHGEQIIVVAIFVSFLRIFKVYHFTLFHVHDRGIAENGPSWLRRHFGNNNVVFLRRISVSTR